MTILYQAMFPIRSLFDPVVEMWEVWGEGEVWEEKNSKHTSSASLSSPASPALYP